MVDCGDVTSRPIQQRFVRVIYIPIAAPGFFHLVGLAAGVVVSAILSAVLLGVPSLLIPIPLPDKVSDAIKIGPFVLAILVGPVIWMYAYNSMRHKRAMKPTQYRTDRLTRVIQHPKARERLPHRWIEYFLRETPRSDRRVAQFFASIAKEHCIVIAPRRGEQAPRPLRRNLAFEPIELLGASERAMHLCEQLFDPDGTYSDVQELSSPAKIRKSILPVFLSLLNGLGVVWFFFHFLFSPLLRGSAPNPILVVCFVLLGAITLYSGIFTENRWWVAPGALLCRRIRRFGSRVDSFRCTPATTPLLLDLRANRGFVVGSEKVRQFNGTPIGCWLVLAGWLSDVPPPNDLEVQHFLGIES